ncbi:hypothetical protein TTHERM_00672240 (macronuclear) [Tetrahymena thermophila SB210]|uniref:Uncharacterized protein n=1 Tax=Tetrahymena thermophila (strain SB210) TaxID=312017 RepID=Q23E31_TETTS|nr:hypothetical protein TTHERM_00672240 [Tetrahymena thermophila SB210]EAR94756.1 hypothetical protein TTHERM_00672240 [Tetrahymena thermophila SB210]|eukprot:XP_001015001.1 hypothetical protein TTHERM_00672240 [Tetrahymena thermophila SB210]
MNSHRSQSRQKECLICMEKVLFNKQNTNKIEKSEEKQQQANSIYDKLID